MLPRPQRLTKPREYSRVYKTGQQISSSHLRLIYEFSDQNLARFGFVISKKQVAKIALRNRLKRILRAEIRRFLPELISGFNAVIQAKPASAPLPADLLRQELAQILKKAKLFKNDQTPS